MEHTISSILCLRMLEPREVKCLFWVYTANRTNEQNKFPHSFYSYDAGTAAEASHGPYSWPLDQTGQEFPFYALLYLGPEKAQSQCVETGRGKLGSFDAVFYSIWRMSLWRRENKGAKTEKSRDVGLGSGVEEGRGGEGERCWCLSLQSWPFLRPRHILLLEFLETPSTLLTNSFFFFFS